MTDFLQTINPSDVIATYSEQHVDPARERPEHWRKQQIRAEIAKRVADPESLLGTTADGTALALLGLCHVIVALADHGSASVKQALTEAAGGQLVPMARTFLQQLAAGEVTLPALLKGIDAVTADIIERSNGVAQVLAEAQQKEEVT